MKKLIASQSVVVMILVVALCVLMGQMQQRIEDSEVRKHYRHEYHICARRMDKGTCAAPRISNDVLENAIVDRVQERLFGCFVRHSLKAKLVQLPR